jgi:hypothetical protein
MLKADPPKGPTDFMAVGRNQPEISFDAIVTRFGDILLLFESLEFICANPRRERGGSVSEKRKMKSSCIYQKTSHAFLAAATGAMIMHLVLVGAAFSQTWSTTVGDWGAASNWTPATVPNSPSATATFNAVNNIAYGVFLTGGPFTVGTLNFNNDVSGGFSFK